jgi:hypothetical protein
MENLPEKLRAIAFAICGVAVFIVGLILCFKDEGGFLFMIIGFIILEKIGE